MRIVFLVFTSVIFFSSCATVPLQDSGKMVQYLKQFPPNDSPSNYKELQTLSCSKGKNFRRPGENIISCQNELRNKSADLGADLFIVQHEQIGTPGKHACPNCITIVGTAYKKKK